MSKVTSSPVRTRKPRRPASPPRQRWFVDPGTWDPERVVAACRDWADQIGAPPSYYDWGPQERVSPGSSGALAEKWEREHPAWPSTAVVHRHLGGFRGMLLAAGFDAPAPIEIPFSERVAAACRLRASGVRWAEIGELLGVSTDTARRYANAHTCVCGDPILARDAELCRRCSSRNRTRWGRVFTDQEIVAAIRAWARLEGRAPAIVDWRPHDRGGHPRWERDCPRFPPCSHVVRRFGSWNAALQAAGFDRPRPDAWSEHEIVEALRAWARTHGFAPSSSDWETSPDRNIISSRFGGWNAALAAAGLEPRFVRRDWTDEQLLAGLRRFARDHGRPPRSADRVGSLGHYPSPALIVTRFGSWSTALRAAGLEPGNPPPTSAETIVEALRVYREAHGRSPSSSTWKANGGSPAAETIIRHCGSWRAGLELAGLPAPTPAPRGPSDSDILATLSSYAREVGSAPTIRAWKQERRQPGIKLIRSRFGSWSAALERAGIDKRAGP